jgi:hypothetical protein
VRDRQEGRQTYYTAHPTALIALVDWASQMAGYWEHRLDQLEDLLNRMDR